MYNDKTLVCKECGQEFVFTAGEQEFYAERGFENEPQRCRACRAARKGGSARPERTMYDAVCSECGKPCKVPFNPSGDRPVYCSDCFANRSNRNRYEETEKPPGRAAFCMADIAEKGRCLPKWL